MRVRRVASIKEQLIKKSREAMLAAVQIYNNPQITFKSESFITLVVIAWTYLMHAYYRSQGIDYRYFAMKGSRKTFHKTKNGAVKLWELERCINCDACPLDEATKHNLRFLIGIRHEIEHQMTMQLDDFLSAKLQACAINFDCYLVKFFGEKYGISQELSIAIQFSSLMPEQEQQLLNQNQLYPNLSKFISSFENSLSDADLQSPRYAYRVLYVPISVNRKGQADRVIEFVKHDSPIKGDIEQILIKETEKRKYLPSFIVKQMNEEGYDSFNMTAHTRLWKENDAKNPSKHFGAMVAKTWYWYESWLTFVRAYCDKNLVRMR